MIELDWISAVFYNEVLYRGFLIELPTFERVASLLANDNGLLVCIIIVKFL